MTDSARGTSRSGTGIHPVGTASDSAMVRAIARAGERASIGPGLPVPDSGDIVIVVDPMTDFTTRYAERPGARGHCMVPIDLNDPATDTDED